MTTRKTTKPAAPKAAAKPAPNGRAQQQRLADAGEKVLREIDRLGLVLDGNAVDELRAAIADARRTVA